MTEPVSAFGTLLDHDSVLAPLPAGQREWQIIVLDTDGSRRVVAQGGYTPDEWNTGTVRPAWTQRYKDHPIVLWYRPYPVEGMYLPYLNDDGSIPQPSTAPVNQVPMGLAWKADIARAAHMYSELEATLRASATSTVVYSGVRDLVIGTVGSCWRVVGMWMGLDPTDDQWRRGQNDMASIMAGLRELADTETWLRRLANNVDLSDLRGALDAGRIPTINRSTNPWSTMPPEHDLTTVGHTPINRFRARMTELALQAVNYYDDVLAPSLTPHQPPQ